MSVHIPRKRTPAGAYPTVDNLRLPVENALGTPQYAPRTNAKNEEVRRVTTGERRSPVTQVQMEIKAGRKIARALWLQIRERNGLTRFTDPPALRGLEVAVERVWGDVQFRDIEAAIRKYGADRYAKSPWYLDTWAQQERTAREERERTSAPVDVQIAAMRAARR